MLFDKVVSAMNKRVASHMDWDVVGEYKWGQGKRSASGNLQASKGRHTAGLRRDMVSRPPWEVTTAPRVFPGRYPCQED